MRKLKQTTITAYVRRIPTPHDPVTSRKRKAVPNQKDSRSKQTSLLQFFGKPSESKAGESSSRPRKRKKSSETKIERKSVPGQFS